MEITIIIKSEGGSAADVCEFLQSIKSIDGKVVVKIDSIPSQIGKLK